MKNSWWVLFLLSSMVLPGFLFGVDYQLETRFQMGMGGDTFATVYYDDGSVSDLDMGTYLTIALGGIASLRLGDAHALEAELLAGWGGWSTGPQNTDDFLLLGRFPVELLGFYRFSPRPPLDVRFGGGVVHQFIGGIEGKGNLSYVSYDIEDSTGWIAELGVRYDVFLFSIRYNAMKYTVQDVAEPMDASSIAVAVGFLFPLKTLSKLE